ncbi:MAG: D-glycerate dehydrogenase [Proteobacteria bacterium]|nr:D-glycerate dehydrogenase [Pseudomonadota bacterium]
MATATKPHLLVTRRLPEAVENRIGQSYAAEFNMSDVPMTGDAIAEQSAGKDAILVAAGDAIGEGVVARVAESVRIIATFSVGIEHIGLQAARQRGIAVTNTPDVLTAATADMAILLMLAASRRLGEGERVVRAGRWTGWAPTQLMGTQVTGKRLGVIGMGRIGRAVARRARAFDMLVHYTNRNRLAASTEDGAHYHSSLESLLKVSDVLSIHCPLTPETRGLINAARLRLLPKGAVVVNTARGPVVDDEALVAALTSGQVVAAGLDVYDGEPKLNQGYMALENVVLAPHLGSATVETRNAMGFRALDNLDAYFADGQPKDRVA